MARPQEKEIRFGETFVSFAEFWESKERYEANHFANYRVAKSTLDTDANIKYKVVRYVCKKYGHHQKTTTKRKTKTYTEGCKSYINVSKVKVNDQFVLRITGFQPEHNHERTEQLFRQMPKQRKAAINAKSEHIQNVLAVKANMRAVQKQVNDPNTGAILLKDLHNFKAQMKKNHHQNDLVNLVHEMCQIEDATVKVIKNDQQELDCIFFQDQRMKEYFNSYPDLLMFDGTYKLNDRRMPLVVMLVVDGNGESQIAGLCIVRSENAATFNILFDEFKAENPRHSDIEVILSDKSFANRNAFKASFPNTHHQLCIFHVLQIFNREITTVKRSISVRQREKALQILKRMVYAQSQGEYDAEYTKLTNMKCKKLLSYFNTNWHNIQEQWVGFKVNRSANYENRTNNRLENVNQKIKSVVAKYSRLETFFADLMTLIASFNIERDYVAAESILRKPLAVVNDTEFDKKYSKILTSYAYDKYKLQSMKFGQIKFTRIRELEAECIENDVTITVTDDKCECTFFRTMKLPCAHLIAFFMHHDECPFKPFLCADRWKRSNVPFSGEFAYSAKNSHHIVSVPSETQGRRNKTPNEKFHYAEVETKKICEILAEKSQVDYDRWLLILKEFRVFVENNQLPNIQSPCK